MALPQTEKKAYCCYFLFLTFMAKMIENDNLSEFNTEKCFIQTELFFIFSIKKKVIKNKSWSCEI